MGGPPTSTPAPLNEMVADAGRWGTRSKAGGSLRPKLHLRRVLESCSVSIAQCPLHSEGLLKCCIAAKATKVGICPTGALGEFLSSPLVKKSLLFFIWWLSHAASMQGALRPIITKRGRGAVDATLSCAQEIAGRRQTRERSSKGARDERHCCGRWSRVVLASVVGVRSRGGYSAQPGADEPSNPRGFIGDPVAGRP